MKIKKTNNYDIFSSVEGNRAVNPNHVKKLMSAMEKELLVSPIIVNERLEVIDGQHRLAACSRLGLPIYYITVEGYDREQVQMLNVNSRNWSTDDFVESMISKGSEDYTILKAFREKFKIPYTSSVALLGSLSSEYNRQLMFKFKEGDFKIKDLKRGQDVGDLVEKASKYFEAARTKYFVSAITRCYDNPVFDGNDFIHKLSLNSSMINKCRNTKQYLEVIEEIYNYRRRDKVNLRF
jgi:hypothetical protein|tara:strand:- start:120 stop:830 length:711 start_codon:yes stop_codon:yes gene_type:complete